MWIFPFTACRATLLLGYNYVIKLSMGVGVPHFHRCCYLRVSSNIPSMAWINCYESISSFPAHHYHMIIRKITIFAINSLWALALKCFWCRIRNGRKLKAEKLAKALADSRTIDPNHCLHLFTPPPCDLGKNVVPSLENTKKLLQKKEGTKRNERENFCGNISHSTSFLWNRTIPRPFAATCCGLTGWVKWGGAEDNFKRDGGMGAWPKTHVDPARCFSSNKYGKPNKLCR